MTHHIIVSADGVPAEQLQNILRQIDGVSVQNRAAGRELALDPSSVNLIIDGGFTTVSALITAVATVWSTRHDRRAGPDSSAVLSIVVMTDLDDITVEVNSNGVVNASSAPLPDRARDVIGLRIR